MFDIHLVRLLMTNLIFAKIEGEGDCLLVLQMITFSLRNREPYISSLQDKTYVRVHLKVSSSFIRYTFYK